MNNLNVNYERILEVLQKISKEQLLTYQRRQPKMSDLELVSLSLTAEFMEIDNEFEDYFIVDSMPLEVCKLSRSSRSKICKDDTYAFPDKGYCASQSSNYYGYKLHAVCSVSGVFQSVDLSPASVMM